MIEAVVVDLGGVAARFLPERRLAALTALSGIAPGVIQERLFDSGFERRAELGVYSPDQVVEAIQAALDRRVSVTQIIDAWALAFNPDTEVLDYIASLPVRCAIFTNNGPMIDACMAGPLQGLAAVFNEIICSWHIQARKPQAAAFERAVERLGSSPDRLLLLDDSADNINAAIHCGWAGECVTGLEELTAATRRYSRLWAAPRTP